VYACKGMSSSTRHLTVLKRPRWQVGPQTAQSESRVRRGDHKRDSVPFSSEQMVCPGATGHSTPVETNTCLSFLPGITPATWPAGPQTCPCPKPKIQIHGGTHIMDTWPCPGCGCSSPEKTVGRMVGPSPISLGLASSSPTSLSPFLLLGCSEHHTLLTLQR
jgi:hypothetical protein